MFIITCAILVPINKHFYWLPTIGQPKNPNEPPTLYWQTELQYGALEDDGKELPDPSYLWAYSVFTYRRDSIEDIVYLLRALTIILGQESRGVDLYKTRSLVRGAETYRDFLR